MRKQHIVLVLLSIILSSSFLTTSAQVETEKLVEIDYSTAQELHPIQTQSMEVGKNTMHANVEQTEDGLIFMLLYDIGYPQVISLVHYSLNNGFTLLRNFSQVLGGLHSRDDTLVLLGSMPGEEPFSIFELDFQGNVTAQIPLSIGNQYLYPNQLFLGEESNYYLFAIDPYHLEQHLLKIDNYGMVIRDDIIGDFHRTGFQGMVLLPESQVMLYNGTYLESRTGDGELLWNVSICDQLKWYIVRPPIVHSNAIYLLSSYMDGVQPIGRNILKYDFDGNLLWNTSIVAKHPVGSYAESFMQLFNVQENSIFGLTEIYGAYNNPYLFSISQDGELQNYWSLNYILLGSEVLEFISDGSPLVITVNRTSPDQRYLTVLTYPSLIPQPVSPGLSSIIGLVLITIGSAMIIGVLVLFYRSKKQ